MATSKVKTIAEIKERGDGNNKTFYHNCILDDNTKISIGKKTSWSVNVWDEIEYEIVEKDWKQKAQVVKKAFTPWGWAGKQRDYSKECVSMSASYTKDLIIAWVIKLEEFETIAERFFIWMNKKY